MNKTPETKSISRIMKKASAPVVRLIEFLENMKINRRNSFLILLFIIFLRNLLESQFEFPGFIGFVKVPVDSAYAFFLHFPLFYFTVFFALYLVLSWLRADNDKAFNVLVSGFSVILIPPIFDYVIMGRSYHLSYFFEFDAYAKGLVGIALPWLKNIGQVSLGQRIEVYLSNLLVFSYLLASKRGIIRALIGFFATHFIIAGFGGLGILLKGFMEKNWLMFSHHQIFIQVFAIFLIIAYGLYRRGNKANPVRIESIIAYLAPAILALAGILYCLKLNLPLAISPFVYSSIASVLIACGAAGLGFQKRNLVIALLCLCLAISVRYETLIFVIMLLLAINMKTIIKLKLIRTLVAGIAGIFALYAGSSIFFFYHTISLTPVMLVALAFIFGALSCVLTRWWLLLVIYAGVLLSCLLIPGRGSIMEHVKILSAVSDFRQNNFPGTLANLRETKSTSLSSFIRGAALVNIGYAAEGLSYLENIDSSEIDRNVIYAKLAAYNQLGQVQKGVEVINCGLHSGIMMDALLLEKARQLILKNELYMALSCLDSAYALGAKKEDVLILAGDIACKQGKYREAIKVYKFVQEINPTGYYAYAQEGLVQFNIGDHDRALNLFLRALELDNKDAVVYNNYGVVLRAMGRFGEARAAFLNAIKISPVFIDAFFNLGFLSSMESNNEEAGYWYKKALEINPNFIPARQALEKL